MNITGNGRTKKGDVAARQHKTETKRFMTGKKEHTSYWRNKRKKSSEVINIGNG